MSGKPQVCTHPACGRKPVARRLCRAHYQAAWKAGQLGQHRPLPYREPGPTICPPDHKHAESTTCYIQHQCRCTACRRHHTVVEQRRTKQKAYGRWDDGLVDAEPARQHLTMLSEHGIGYKRVAALAGLGVTPVRNIIWGRQDPGPRHGELPKRIKRETSEKVLAVQPVLENLGDRQPVKAFPYVRRLQALVALGWSQSKLGGQLGVTPGNFRWLRDYEAAGTHRHRVMISAKHARAIVALYDRLAMTPPPATTHQDKIATVRARNYARGRGWPLPMDWEASDNNFTAPTPARRSAA